MKSHFATFLMILALAIVGCKTKKEPEKYDDWLEFFDHMEDVVPPYKLAMFKALELDSAGTWSKIVHPYFKSEYHKIDPKSAISMDLEQMYRVGSDTLKILALEIRFHFYEHGLPSEVVAVRRVLHKLHFFRHRDEIKEWDEIIG